MRFDVYFGVLLASTGDTRNEYLYAGEQYNAETGLYYNRARYMDPSTGTFISMDSYNGSIYDPVSLHKYLYANANPVTYTDPTGYFSFTELAVVQKIQGIINTVQMSSGLFKVLRWVNAITTVYDVFQQIKGLLNGEVTIGEVIHMIMSDMAIDAMLSWLCNTKLKVVLKPVMAIMAGDAAFKQMTDAWENGSTLDKIMYAAKFVAYVFGLAKQCFTGDTLVWTENGSVAISEVKVGDFVYAYDFETGETVLTKVTAVSVSETDELVHLTIDGELIRTTASHPFYTTEGEWKAAGDLKVGDRVVTITGEATVEAVDVEKLSEAVTVYNLTVEGEHNYYVAENGVLVHNECGDWGNASTNESPALKDSPYNLDVVDSRVKPDYVPNPAHDALSGLYNPHKTPEPLDSRAVYENAVRGGMGEWYGVNESGEIYQFFYDNTEGVHFAGIISKQDLANKNSSILRILGISVKGKR